MTTLLDVVKSYLNEAEISQNKVMRLLEIGKRGLDDINIDVSGLPTTVELDFNSDSLTSSLPPDYITYKVIGYVAGGVIVPFAQNPRIKLYPDNGDCKPTNTNAGFTGINNLVGLGTGYLDYPYWGNYGTSSLSPNGLVGGFSSLGGDKGYVCDFRIDELNGFIQYGCNPGVTIVMEYLADLKKVSGEYVVHPFDIPALMAWLAWRDIENKKVSNSDKERKKYEYYRERGLARKRHYSITISAAYQKIRQTANSAPIF
ncbi:hypothetical protein [uncultured Flavobacterium sp.]|uniref:hypothetical protein n=1 Tax=uncultured Flavobacterium sp. TaxID=165435 RepID=UPI002596179E|nr:hypothetical protein [uncultured Flavobacterium sp.]